MTALRGSPEGIVADSIAAVADAAGRRVAERLPGNPWHRDTEADTHVFSYKRDFADLWGLVTPGRDAQGLATIVEALAGRELNIVIVWDGLPAEASPDRIAARRYVSPYEWGLAFSLLIYRRFGRTDESERPRVRILILEAIEVGDDAGLLRQSFFAFHNAFPWVQSYRIVKVGEEQLSENLELPPDSEMFKRFRQTILPRRCDAQELLMDLVDPRRIFTTFEDDSDSHQTLEAVAKLQQEQFLKAGNRHDAANLLGALVLAEGLPPRMRERVHDYILGGGLPRLAMHSLARVINLVSTDNSAATQAVGPKSIGLLKDGGIFDRRRHVRFLLIDDQFRLGYQHILGYAIFGSNYTPGAATEESEFARLECFDKWDEIKGVLDSCNQVEDWDQPRRLTIPNCDVLLLDLRLWLHEEDGKRKGFMDELCNVCERLGADRIDDPSFKSARRAAEQLARGDEDISELSALALLPLLLNHYDPSLPIVLFSSTHQREVLGLVADRPSIITSFSKPLLSGYGTGLRQEESIGTLMSALRKAVDIHEARVLWEKVCEVSWGWQPPFIISWPGSDSAREYNMPWGETHAPQKPTPSLRASMKSLFLDYLARERYFDFASLPFELIEGALSPVNGRLVLPTHLADDERCRSNELAVALQWMRHRKAHGYATPPLNEHERTSWRVACIVVFMTLLDYLRGSACDLGGCRRQESADWFWLSFRLRYRKALRHVKPDKPDEADGTEETDQVLDIAALPQRLIAKQEVPWVDFCTYAILYAIDRGRDENLARVCPETYHAVTRLARFLTGTLADICDKIHSGEKLELLVTGSGESSFHVGRNGVTLGFCGDRGSRAVGDQVTVKFREGLTNEHGWLHVDVVE